MDYAALFPGQGSQFVGMGSSLFEELPDLLGESADATLGWSLRDACLAGPAEHLTRTDVAQPALYALSYAAWTLWRDRVGTMPAAAAGHSLGEYSALAAAGAFDFIDGLALVAARGRAMAAAAAATPSGMAAVVGAGAAELEEICAARRSDGGGLWVANLNAPGQTVVAGTDVDIAWLLERSSSLGLRRVIALEVAGAFHSPLMEPAAATFAAELRRWTFGPLAFPVWSNVDAAPHGDDVGGSLLRQLTSPVRFAETLTSMAEDGIKAFVHVGPGTVTAGMARRTVAGAATAAFEDGAGVAAAGAELGLSIE
jgi:[acyl-carrier-protein] S-malonyltransferase